MSKDDDGFYEIFEAFGICTHRPDGTHRRRDDIRTEFEEKLMRMRKEPEQTTAADSITN